MTVKEMRAALKAACRIYNPPPHNSCDKYDICESCRMTGHTPKYMSDGVVEIVYADMEKRGTVQRCLKRKKLKEICDAATPEQCSTSVCPISAFCDLHSRHSPHVASYNEIEAIYADAVRYGVIKEE